LTASAEVTDIQTALALNRLVQVICDNARNGKTRTDSQVRSVGIAVGISPYPGGQKRSKISSQITISIPSRAPYLSAF
jgi:hypothetical protein